MDPEGNYLLLGGSGDEYSYSAESNGQVHTKRKFEPDNTDLTYRQFVFFDPGERHLGVLPGGGEQERGQAVRGHVWQPRYSNICDT